jgi:serine/threonine protein phosphatase PrpC
LQNVSRQDLLSRTFLFLTQLKILHFGMGFFSSTKTSSSSSAPEAHSASHNASSENLTLTNTNYPSSASLPKVSPAILDSAKTLDFSPCKVSSSCYILGATTLDDKVEIQGSFFVELSHGKKAVVFGVLSAHGQNGQQVTQIVHSALLGSLIRDPSINEHPLRSLQVAFANADRELARCGVDLTLSGTACTIGVLLASNRLFIANLGEIACLQVVPNPKKRSADPVTKQLNIQHNTSYLVDVERVINSGGRVEPFRGMNGEPIGPKRVWLSSERVPGLRMTRCFGNSIAKAIGVISIPSITEHSIVGDELYIVVANDGVWDMVKPVPVGCALVRGAAEGSQSIHTLAHRIATQCLEMQRKADFGCSSEIALMVLKLQKTSS